MQSCYLVRVRPRRASNWNQGPVRDWHNLAVTHYLLDPMMEHLAKLAACTGSRALSDAMPQRTSPHLPFGRRGGWNAVQRVLRRQSADSPVTPTPAAAPHSS